MSGDVQPRKRKDKKKKKDELGLEEPRGTAAALGEGDVFMHSYSDHGTGGHWCAKIIFFSLLAVLVTLIGLIILENRGLSELEANAVESRYSNILEGWIEDAPDDDHHDEHTLELKHHDDDEEDDHYNDHDVGDHDDDHEDDEHADEDDDDHADEDEDEHLENDEDEHGDEDQEENADEGDDDNADEEDDSNADEDENTQEDDDENDDQLLNQQDLDDDEDEDDRHPYKYYTQDEDDDEDDAKKYDEEETEEYDQDAAQDEDEDEQNDENESNEELGNEDEDSEDRDVEGDEDEEMNENNDDEDENITKEDEDEHEDHEEEDDEVEVERIEREASEEEPISIGLPVLKEEDDDDGKDDDHDEAEEDNETEADDGEEEADDDFLEVDETPPVVERVTAPAGKPFVEVDEDDDSTETPPDTLEEEEEYEKQQEELRKEEEQSSHHIWLKLTVGAALLVATHAVLRRATAPRDEPEEEREEREETPLVDRRMTLIPQQAAPTVDTKKESEKPIFEEIVRREAPVVKAPPVVKQESEEEVEELEEVVEEEEIEEEPEKLEAPTKEADKELYSDEEEEEEEIVVPKKEAPKVAVPPKPAPEPEEDPDDVEIIDDEQIEDELEEEEDDVSDVDDAELLSRLEAKYGRLPEPERPGQKHKDGGNSVEDSWPGEPADAYWRQQLDSAERELRQGAWSAALSVAGAGALAGSARARFVTAAALDRMAEARRDNTLLSKAIAAYFHLLEMSERLPDKKLVEVARRTLDRIQFRGNYLKAEPVYRLLIRRFPNEPAYRNNLTISFLMANRNDLAEDVLKETLARWPDDRVALAHYAFILKTNHKNRLEEAVELFQKALDGDKGPACEPRFYYHFGDALLMLGRFKEAHEVHIRGAKLGHFLSPSQRSLYNVPRLKSRPWWDVNETPYAGLARNLEKRWKEILKEGQRAAALFKEEEEGLRERGEWGQMDLFVRGQEVAGRCVAAPATCAAVRAEPGAAGCRRGQVKFSSMAPGTHVRPHVGPTNCRLRMHLGLSNTTNTFLRVDKETRQWQEGKVLLFDDSFEHEVWHNGSGARLVLIVDVWHPDLTAQERRTLPPI